MNEAERNRLVVDNMPLVTTIAADYRGRGVDFEDLLAIGREGLVNAAISYSPAVGKFSRWASVAINSALAHELRSGRYHSTETAKVLDWGQEHTERVHDWTGWGNGGNARAIYEIWPEDFDGSPETLTERFDDIREKRDRFDAAFISLKARERKVLTLVCLRDPAMSIERAAREMGISYKSAWGTLRRAIQKMHEIISAMERNEKPVIDADPVDDEV